MDMTTMVIVGLILLGIGGAVAFYFYKKKNLETLFNQVYETSKQVPAKKRNSFLLLMFKEAMSAAKKKSKTTGERLNNPKYVEIQMIHMSKILKDPTNVTDKTIKKSLNLYNSYLIWEKAKREKAKKTV